MSMWMNGLRSNISETERGLVVPSTNLGSQDDPNLDGAGETVPDPDIIPEFPHEKDPNGENPTLSTNSRNSTTELVPSATSAENNRTKRQSMCERFEPDCTPDKDPEPSDPGSSDKGASPDGSSCERFELGCLNPRPSDTIQPEEPMQPEEPKQPEEPNQPEVAETETVAMEPLSNTSKKNLLMKWMTWAQSYVTYVDTSSFLWLNESAAMPYISEWNWQMATTALYMMAIEPSWFVWSLEVKRVYAHWAEWVLQPKMGESNTTEWVENLGAQQPVEIIRTQFDQFQLQFNATS